MDFEIFDFLLKQKFTTRPQLLKKFAPRHVGNRACDTSLDKRLRKLRTGTYIRTLKVSGRTLYLVGSRGHQAIRNPRLLKIPVLRTVDEQTLQHDLICTDARLYLEDFGAYDWQAETELRLHPSQPMHYPDAAFRYGERIVFLEIETSGKSLSRYRDLASIYNLPKGPDRVLYFYKDTSIARGLSETMGSNPRVGLFPYASVLPEPGLLNGSHCDNHVTLKEFLEK